MPYWSSPPLCCLLSFVPCCLPARLGFLSRPDVASVRLLRFCRASLFLYLVGMPLVPFLQLLVRAQLAHGHIPTVLLLLLWSQWVLSMLALYALFIAYRLTHTPLHAFRTTAKFATIKVLVLLSPVQKELLKYSLGVQLGEFWNTALLAAEMPALGFLLLRAFPASELPQLSPAPEGADFGAREPHDGAWRSTGDILAPPPGPRKGGEAQLL